MHTCTHTDSQVHNTIPRPRHVRGLKINHWSRIFARSILARSALASEPSFAHGPNIPRIVCTVHFGRIGGGGDGVVQSGRRAATAAAAVAKRSRAKEPNAFEKCAGLEAARASLRERVVCGTVLIQTFISFYRNASHVRTRTHARTYARACTPHYVHVMFSRREVTR